MTQSALADILLPHDISVLFPMPKDPLDQEAVLVDAFISKIALKQIPRLEPTLRKDTQATRLQLVAVRFDPPEIRLVWQIFHQLGNRIEAMDAAVHSFYQITDEKTFLADLKKASSYSRNEVNILLPLSVHPTLKNEGINGKYGKELISLIKKHARIDNLFKVTFMAMSLAETKWDFGGMNLVKGELAPLIIPRVNTMEIQTFINQSFHEFSGGFGPAPKGQDEFNRLVNDSYKAQVREPQNLLKAHLTSRRIENPRLETVDTMDCVSCHLAQTARTWIENESPSLAEEVENKFTSKKYILKNTTTDPGRTDNVHAFSYFLDMATINQRTINETAMVLEKLN